jgi:tellurite resistance protein TerC
MVKMPIAPVLAPEPGRNKLVSLARRWLPVTADLHGRAFFVRENGVRSATPLLLALLVVEGSDLLFAVDSLPAVIAVTTDPFLAFSSNAFAVLGLRSLYFVIAPFLSRFRYLKTSLIFVLAFIGSKMLLAHHHPIPASVSLGFIVGILGVGVVASLVGARRDPVLVPSPVGTEIDRLVRTSVRGTRRVVVAVAGLTAIGIGVAMLVLPGPGIVVIAVGLAVLSTEFVWAQRWLARVRAAAERYRPSRDRRGG